MGSRHDDDYVRGCDICHHRSFLFQPSLQIPDFSWIVDSSHHGCHRHSITDYQITLTAFTTQSLYYSQITLITAAKITAAQLFTFMSVFFLP